MSKLVLNVGAGKTNNPIIPWLGDDLEFTRLDVNPLKEPDIIHDIYDPMPSELIGKFDCAVASHLLEHIDWHLTGKILKNIASTLKDDGCMVIVVPDLTYACLQMLKGNFSLGILCCIYGGQYNEWDYHLVGFTQESITEALRLIGWKVVNQNSRPFSVHIDGHDDTAYEIVTMAIREGQTWTH